MKEKTMKDAVAILCAGGPAPGINTVISAVTKIFLQNGYKPRYNQHHPSTG